LNDTVLEKSNQREKTVKFVSNRLQMNKEKLIKTIRDIEDSIILEDIFRLLEIQGEENIFETSREQKKAIKKAKLEISIGEVLSSENAEKEIDEWLDK
jgi:hypothetical protein